MDKIELSFNDVYNWDGLILLIEELGIPIPDLKYDGGIVVDRCMFAQDITSAWFKIGRFYGAHPDGSLYVEMESEHAMLFKLSKP